MKTNVGFPSHQASFKVGFGEVHEVTKILDEVYEGEYEVTPKVEEQTLETKEKFMTDDVTVHAIPVFEVTNAAGGLTVYIAKE